MWLANDRFCDQDWNKASFKLNFAIYITTKVETLPAYISLYHHRTWVQCVRSTFPILVVSVSANGNRTSFQRCFHNSTLEDIQTPLILYFDRSKAASKTIAIYIELHHDTGYKRNHASVSIRRWSSFQISTHSSQKGKKSLLHCHNANAIRRIPFQTSFVDKDRESLFPYLNSTKARIFFEAGYVA